MSIVSCAVEGCNRPARNKGLCSTHYKQQRFGQEFTEIVSRRTLSPEVCEQEGCTRPGYGLGYCYAHYQRYKKGADMTKPLRKVKTGAQDTCTVEGCEGRHVAKGLCGFHYERQRKGIPFDRPYKPRQAWSVCSLPGCDDLHAGWGFCKRHGHLRSTHNLTVEQMLFFEGRPCQICGSPALPCVDHDHDCCPGDGSCGECVRDILCRACNSGLGHFKDDPDLFISALNYLARFGKVGTTPNERMNDDRAQRGQGGR